MVVDGLKRNVYLMSLALLAEEVDRIHMTQVRG
jgi:hypothetical protein